MGENIPGGNFLGGKFTRGSLIGMNFPYGNFPDGSFPDTIFWYRHILFEKNDSVCRNQYIFCGTTSYGIL